jgi:hypothetical protein
MRLSGAKLLSNYDENQSEIIFNHDKNQPKRKQPTLEESSRCELSRSVVLESLL